MVWSFVGFSIYILCYQRIDFSLLIELINFITPLNIKTNRKNKDINKTNNLGPSVIGIVHLIKSSHIPKPLPPLEISNTIKSG